MTDTSKPARRRSRTAAETVIKLPAQLAETCMKGMTPDQRATLSAKAAGSLLEGCNKLAERVGLILEESEQTDGEA